MIIAILFEGIDYIHVKYFYNFCRNRYCKDQVSRLCRYTLTNKNNAAVRLITLGAGIQSITLPNKNADMSDVILGFDDVSGWLIIFLSFHSN